MATFDGSFVDESGADYRDFSGADQTVVGNDVIPIMGDIPQVESDGPYSPLRDLLGSIGSIRQTARDIGTAVGKTERDLRAAKGEYQTARNNAANGNSALQWWQYASPTDRAMLVLAAGGLIVAIWQSTRGN